MKFNFDDYKGNYVMHCKTKNEAKEFCKLMHKDGRTWNSGESYLDEFFIKGPRYYYFNRGTHGERVCDDNYIILEWSDFNGIPELKTGDVVTFGDGSKCLVFKEFDVYIDFKNGFCGGLNNYNNNLETKYGSEFTIIKIQRTAKHNPHELIPKYWSKMPTIWERKPEVTELTLDEIADKFNVDVANLRIKEK